MMVETDGPWKFQENVMTHPRMIREVLKEISVIKTYLLIRLQKQYMKIQFSFI